MGGGAVARVSSSHLEQIGCGEHRVLGDAVLAAPVQELQRRRMRADYVPGI